MSAVMVCSAYVIRSRSSWMDVLNDGTQTLSLTNPQRKKSHGVRSGERGGQGRRLLFDPALWKNTIEKHSYIRVKMEGGGEFRPVVECNRHNVFSWSNNQFSNMSRNESTVTVASVKKNGPCTLWRDTAKKR
jgi:hypothetical protein